MEWVYFCTSSFWKKYKKSPVLPVLQIDIVQYIGLLTDSPSDYLSLALCCKHHSKILEKPKRWRALERFTIISKCENYTEWILINGKKHREDGPAKIRADGTKMWYINNKLHREDGPARIWGDGTKEWWFNGKKMVDMKIQDLPIWIVQHIALLTNSTSDYLNLALCCKKHVEILQTPNRWKGLRHFTQISNMITVNLQYLKKWTINGRRHREDGPAVEWADGTKEWWINGQRHRDCKAGPAIEWADGTKEWYIHGKRHRDCKAGPAIEWADGSKSWYINDVLLKHIKNDGLIMVKFSVVERFRINNRKFK